MNPEPQPFNLAMLSSRIREVRAQRGLTMSGVAKEVGVSTSTIRRLGTADDAEADGVLALVAWLGDPPERFIAGAATPGTPLPGAGTGQVRVDMELIDQADPSRRTGNRPRSRTTIQRLATAALASGKTVASLTRISKF